MRKRRTAGLILSLILALAVILPALPVMAEDSHTVTSFEELDEFCKYDGTITIGSNITLVDAIKIPTGASVTIDLNGKTITRGLSISYPENWEGGNVFVVYGQLTIKDSTSGDSGIGSGKITGGYEYYDGGAILVVAAGKRRVDNRKFKDQFGLKAKMLSPEDTERLTGNAAGGVCPFLVPAEASVWLDVSLRDHDTVYPAAGSAHSGVALSCAELEALARPAGWCDVCKTPEG